MVGTSLDALICAGYRKLISSPKTINVVTTPAVAGTMVALKAFSQRTRSISHRERWELASSCEAATRSLRAKSGGAAFRPRDPTSIRSEEHTSELQSLTNLVCR